jgi:hypothetical protein
MKKIDGEYFSFFSAYRRHQNEEVFFCDEASIKRK